MKRPAESAGIDFVQWRALVRAHLWIDYSALFGALGAREARLTAIRLAFAWGFLSLFGLGLAGIVWQARDPFLAALLATTTMMLWSGLIVVSQPAGLAAPEDHDILGFRPVGSKTLFAVRMTALLLPAGETMLLMGWMPVVAFLTRDDGSAAVAAAAAAALAGAGLTSTLGIVALYGVLIRFVSPARLARVLAYASGAAGLLLTAGVMFATSLFGESEAGAAALGAVLPRDLRTMWFPGAWFASYVALAGGSRGAAEVTGAVLSAGLFATILILLRGRISAVYAARIAEFATVTKPRAALARATWSFLDGERRAIALLVGSHLRGDVRFQLAIAINLATGVMFTLVGSARGLPADPFSGGLDASGVMAPLFPVLVVPAQMYQSLVVNASADAAWLFFVTTADRTRAVTAARDAIAIFVLVPVTLLLAAFYTYAYQHPGHALLQAALIGVMGYVSLQGNVLLAPRLPFSVPLTGDRSQRFPFFSSLPVFLIGTPLFFGVQWIAYRGPVYTATAFAVLFLVSAALNALTRRRIARRASRLAYFE